MALTQISTGMLASGDGTVDLNIDNGTFVVDVSTSRVGIGTTSPASLLHLSSTVPVLSFTDTNSFTDANDRFIIRASSNNGNIQWYDDSASTTTELMTFLPSGNVGIGVLAPTRSLVLGKGDSTGVQTQYTNSTTGAALGDGFTVGIDGSENAEFWNFENTNMLFATNGTERMRIDSSGQLSAVSVSNVRLTLGSEGTVGDNSSNWIRGNSNLLQFNNAGGGFMWETAGAEKMRIDSSGNLLVSKTTTAFGTAGLRFAPTGAIDATVSGDGSLFLNRLSSDGGMAYFYRDGTAVGSIGVVGGNNLYIHGDTIGLGIGDDNIYPTNSSGTSADAITDIGDSSARFRNVYRSGSTISTSDRNMKQDIRDLTDSERNVAVAAKGLLKSFRFIDTVEAEGDSANIHFGIIAQDLAAVFTAEGLDANDYQVYRADTFTDDDGNEQTRLGICYENLLAFIISAI